jgi:hypothetical protein
MRRTILADPLTRADAHGTFSLPLSFLAHAETPKQEQRRAKRNA